MNIHFAEPTVSKMCSALKLGWMLGLKTGSYYLRSRPGGDAIAITSKKGGDSSSATTADENKGKKTKKIVVCDDENGICLMCQ